MASIFLLFNTWDKRCVGRAIRGFTNSDCLLYQPLQITLINGSFAEIHVAEGKGIVLQTFRQEEERADSTYLKSAFLY